MIWLRNLRKTDVGSVRISRVVLIWFGNKLPEELWFGMALGRSEVWFGLAEELGWGGPEILCKVKGSLCSPPPPPPPPSWRLICVSLQREEDCQMGNIYHHHQRKLEN